MTKVTHITALKLVATGLALVIAGYCQLVVAVHLKAICLQLVEWLIMHVDSLTNAMEWVVIAIVFGILFSIAAWPISESESA
jgi:hypothetical protein